MRKSTAAVISAMKANDGPTGLAAETNALPVVLVALVLPLLLLLVVVDKVVVDVVVSVPLHSPKLLQQLAVEPSQHLAANISA